MAESLRNDGAGDAPYLSIVAASRNDDHGGKLLPRMQIFIDGLFDQCRRFDIPAELILVEWNPPEDRSKLADALSWPAEPGPLAVRIIEVPPEIHARFEYAEALPLFQMIAKNVGIHRARGQFILATNIDILFSDQLMERIAARKLSEKYLYRIDRHDADEVVLIDDSGTDKLDFCEKNVIRINQRDGTLYPETGNFDRIYKSRLKVLAWALALTLVFPIILYYLYRLKDQIQFNYLYRLKDQIQFARKKRQKKRHHRHPLFYGTKKFLRLQACRRPEGKLSAGETLWLFCRMMLVNLARTPVRDWRRRLRRSRRHPFHRLKRFLLYRRHLGRGQMDSWPVRVLKVLGFIPIVFCHTATRRLIWERRQAWRDVVFEFRRRRLHTNACGDFTLLSRDRWFRLRGYAEFEMYSFHIDSLLCHSAATMGIRERVLDDPARIYHIEHSEGSGFTPEAQEALWSRMEKSRIERLSDSQFWAMTLDMKAGKLSPLFNDLNWGLVDDDLPEIIPANSQEQKRQIG